MSAHAVRAETGPTRPVQMCLVSPPGAGLRMTKSEHGSRAGSGGRESSPPGNEWNQPLRPIAHARATELAIIHKRVLSDISFHDPLAQQRMSLSQVH